MLGVAGISVGQVARHDEFEMNRLTMGPSTRAYLYAAHLSSYAMHGANVTFSPVRASLTPGMSWDMPCPQSYVRSLPPRSLQRCRT